MKSRHQEGMHTLQGRTRGVGIRLCCCDGDETSANESFVDWHIDCMAVGMVYGNKGQLIGIGNRIEALRRKYGEESISVTYSRRQRRGKALPRQRQPIDPFLWGMRIESLVVSWRWED